MALIQVTSTGAAGGGGGVDITGWAIDEFTQAVAFVSGGVVLSLSQTPISLNSIDFDYNGQTYYANDHFSLSGNQITILFADPYVLDYDSPPIFHIRYPY